MEKIDGRWQVPVRDVDGHERCLEVWAAPGQVVLADPEGDTTLLEHIDACEFSRVLNNLAAEALLFSLEADCAARQAKESD